mmetsp:Transcript_10218/g.9026  ORF Transcript_10218/g.9026 Transcript_10218/m.9026 type:complete len:137 (-) Transcript_10218:49-459(-)
MDPTQPMEIQPSLQTPAPHPIPAPALTVPAPTSFEEIKEAPQSPAEIPEIPSFENKEKEEEVNKKYSVLKKKYKALRTEYLSILELVDSTNSDMKSLTNERNFLKSKLDIFINSQSFNDTEDRSPNRLSESNKQNS